MRFPSPWARPRRGPESREADLFLLSVQEPKCNATEALILEWNTTGRERARLRREREKAELEAKKKERRREKKREKRKAAAIEKKKQKAKSKDVATAVEIESESKGKGKERAASDETLEPRVREKRVTKKVREQVREPATTKTVSCGATDADIGNALIGKFADSQRDRGPVRLRARRRPVCTSLIAYRRTLASASTADSAGQLVRLEFRLLASSSRHQSQLESSQTRFLRGRTIQDSGFCCPRRIVIRLGSRRRAGFTVEPARCHSRARDSDRSG